MKKYTGLKGFYCCACLTDKYRQVLKNMLEFPFELRKLTDYDFHSAIMFSDKLPKKLSLERSLITAVGTNFGLLGDNLVMFLESSDLERLHKKWLRLGCIYEYDSYVPHITIIEDLSKKEPRNLESLLNLKFNINLDFLGESIGDLIQ
jgi:hypothetical protein